MKQRIIGLILVVTMAFLTLTGCGFNYAKKDMTKYTDFNATAFAQALQSLSIKEGDFGTKEADRLTKVQNAISAALLTLATDADEKLYAGKPQKDDALYFCYYAMDSEDNIYFISKNMDAAKPSSIQLGLSTLEGLNKAISDAVLAGEGVDIANHIYAVSTTSNTVGEGDIISLTYTKGETTTTREYVDLGKDDKAALESALIGAKVGVVIDELVVGEDTYTNVKVESVLKDKSDLKTKKDDMIFISYTRTCDVSGIEGYTKPADAPGTYKDGKYTETLTYTTLWVGEDADETTKTFLGQLNGQKPGSVSNITVTEDNVPGTNGATLDVTYEKITIHWIVDKANAPIEVKYTPYTEELKADNSNAKKEKDIYGNEHTLNQVELTYGVFPVYYYDVADLTAELIVREFYTELSTTQTKEHDHTEEDHEHETEYVFSTLNDDGYVKDGKTIAALVGELVKLYETHASNEKSLTSATTNLNNALSKLAADDGKSVTTTTNLEKAVTDTTAAFKTASDAVAKSQKDVDAKVAEILACTKGETGVSTLLVEDFNKYQYKTLEDKYKADINSKLADAIYSLAKANVTYKQLPKSAVKQAYKAIMNTYKNKFYEGKYSTGTGTSTSTSTETNYSHYSGNFDKYLIATLTTEKKITENSIEAAEKALWAEAEQTVKDILLIYVLVDYVGEDTVGLTNKEKKDLKKELEQWSRIYQQYGLSYSYNLDDYVHAAQFDKVFNHLLEEGTPTDDPNNPDDQNVLVYKNIAYTTGATK